ncbi:MAG: hypothetical protein NWS92_02215 [Crocinitomicaceae bacterium]|nr:hypothetical protein [Crocinitomicaceae bacterium]MDP4722773.1 hypothetical protein [Crocinitomicaceae bacterium]MDP4739535.1 hypothetical protein [Crocinitomicaceae bacterium]MDP4798719.1 hypothetical protein [Crocinitomicaceae bacterium]MDP4807502.1 hypothetical protein [Crocinitomicaceae bacterium]
MKSLLSFLFTISFFVGQAQQLKTTENRVEIELNDGHFNEDFFTFGENGFVLKSFSYQDGRRGDLYLHHDLYDTNMVLVGEQAEAIDKRNYFYSSFQGAQKVYHLSYARKMPFVIYEYDPANKSTRNYNIPSDELAGLNNIHSFYVVNQRAVAIGVTKTKSYLLFFDLDKETVQATPILVEGFKSKRTFPINVEFIDEKNLFYLSVRAYKSVFSSSAYLQTIDLEGQLSALQKINEGTDKVIKTITVGGVSNDEIAIAGTYSNVVNGASNGIYFATSVNGIVDNISTYNFLEIPNYTSYLPQKTQQRVEKKKERAAKRGKELEANQRIMMHDLIPVDNDFLIIAEAYYPTYRTETRTTYVNGKATTTTVQVFDGYQYTHALVAKFNSKGEMLWSQVFKMYLWYKPMRAKQFIRIAGREQNSIKLVYADGRNIYSKSFSFDGEVLSEKTSNPINTTNENDKIRASYSDVIYWYDKYFLSYGSQSIKNKTDDDVKRKRNVLFMNKISFE